MSSSSPRLSRESLTHLLAAAQRTRYPKRISYGHLERYLTQWFPPALWASLYHDADTQLRTSSPTRRSKPLLHFCRDPPHVSPEWAAALELVALSRLVKTTRDGAAAATHSAVVQRAVPSSSPTVDALEHLLRCGAFPPAGWAVTLTLLQMWRQEQSPQPNASLDPPHAGDAAMVTSELPSLQVGFPSHLPAPAAAQLLHHISLAPPSTGMWSDALLLYHRCASETYASTSKPASAARDTVVPASSAFLKALRHMALTTLLQAGEWERGLHFYYHSLYQRDLPGTVTTGYLVQALGKAGQWAAALQVYELCVKLLRAQRAQRIGAEPQRAELPSRPWGTTLSMAMASVQHCPTAPSTALMAMVAQLQRSPDASLGSSSSASSVTAPPLVQLDGNFLSAVQSLPMETERVAVLRVARQEGLLDTFKLIRGLVSRQRWEDALLLFTESMKAVAPHQQKGGDDKDDSRHDQQHHHHPPSLSLTRREVGEARRNLLHGSSVHSVVAVVAALNRYRTGHTRNNNKQSTVAPAEEHVLALNDQEVECVLSKTLEVNAATLVSSREAADFWRYCLQVLDHNYGTTYTTQAYADDPRGDDAPPSPSSPRSVRRPTTSALSLLLRHPQLPWRTALRLVRDYDLLNASHDETSVSHERSTPAHTVRAGQSTPPHAVVTPRALAVGAAVERLAQQGQRTAAEELACSAIEADLAAAAAAVQGHTRKGVSLSASLLQVVSYATLRDLLLVRHGTYESLYVEVRVLFHLLRGSTQNSTTDFSSLLGDGDRFFTHPCGRALSVVHVLLQRNALSAGSYSPPSLEARETFHQLPAALFLLEGGGADANGSRDAAAARSPTAVPWLAAYPSSVHCEVLRVIRCMTASGSGVRFSETEASVESLTSASALAATWRWTWTLRYLQILAGFFTTPPRDASRDSGRSPARTAVEGRTAYYVATFEAVVCLLDTSSGSHCSTAAHTGVGVAISVESTIHRGEEAAGTPSTSAQRIAALCQLLERAVARYGCLPPTHMLLPNQLDRLLPPLVQGTINFAEERDGVVVDALCDNTRVDALGSAKERCEVAACLLHLTLQALESPCAGGDVSARTTVEPALLNNLLKLCCRVAEYRREMAERRQANAEHGRSVTDGEALCRAGVRILRLQCERCGLHTVRPSTLTLLYYLCSAAQGPASGVRLSFPKKMALRVTEYILQQQREQQATTAQRVAQRTFRFASTAEARRSGCGGSAEGSQRGRGYGAAAATVVVQPHHCPLFFSLFGWEDALDVWYPAFPRDVLNLLAGTPDAVEACLSLEERVRR